MSFIISHFLLHDYRLRWLLYDYCSRWFWISDIRRLVEHGGGVRVATILATFGMATLRTAGFCIRGEKVPADSAASRQRE